METPTPDRLPSLDVVIEHQQARLVDVRDRIERVVLQQSNIAAQLRWLDRRLAQFRQILTRDAGRL